MNEINRLNAQEGINAYFEKSYERNGLGYHFHCYHELILVREGSVESKINGVRNLVGPNSLIVISDLEHHELNIRNVPYSRYVLTITTELSLVMIREPMLLSLLMHRPKQFNHIIPLDQKLADTLALCFEKATQECEQKKAFWETRTAMLTTEILLELYRADSSIFTNKKDTQTVQIILKVQQDIGQEYMNKITLEEMAKRYFISQYYLSRIFKEMTGYGFKTYLTLFRINEAKKMLTCTTLSVTEICYAVGYQNINHFIRVFKENDGCSPLQYRKKYASMNRDGQ